MPQLKTTGPDAGKPAANLVRKLGDEVTANVHLVIPWRHLPMADAQELLPYIGKTLQLEFNDGHVVQAKVVTVDVDHPQEIIYDVIRVVARGPESLASIKPGTVAAAKPGELRSFRVV